MITVSALYTNKTEAFQSFVSSCFPARGGCAVELSKCWLAVEQPAGKLFRPPLKKSAPHNGSRSSVRKYRYLILSFQTDDQT